jgi:diadenosine tetraphosphate (Ap4A) HIT family hydrolase
MMVARDVGKAAKAAFGAPRAGVLIAGLEVPHLHVHVFPAWTMADFDISGAKPAAEADLDAAAGRLTAALASGGPDPA